MKDTGRKTIAMDLASTSGRMVVSSRENSLMIASWVTLESRNRFVVLKFSLN